jgi:hypothetical protein
MTYIGKIAQIGATHDHMFFRALDRGHIGVFYAFKMPKMLWR